VPHSEILHTPSNQIISDSTYEINYSTSILYLKNKSFLKTAAKIRYRVFPLNFSKPYPTIPLVFSDSIQETKNNYTPPFKYHPPDKAEESNFQVNGNISRGISTGNTQNMVVNSNLNLQLSGEISDGLQIEALLSDRNIPVQPDGHTQQINEFDQIYIKLYDSIRSLQMGDVEINATNSHFLKFNRRILGGNFTHQNIKFSDNTTGKSQISAAISKGSFNRTEILGIEGVQGPYPLQGANNETFIVILAGTENVYLDGILQSRGENADYIINYNTAELTFTPNHFITKDSRIIVEFEYSDKNYNRFLFHTQNSIIHKKANYSIQYFTEGDAKNQPVNQVLSDEHKQILADAGNNPFKAMVPNFDSISFDANRILYKMIDTVVNTLFFDSILVHSTNPDSAFYQAGFALVGENKGNYTQYISAANGNVFKWIAPLYGIPQGNYEPIQLLIAPEKKQMVVAKSAFQISNNTVASIELAYANKNPNTFSNTKNTAQNGVAIKNYVEHTIALNDNKLVMDFTYEMAQQQFSPIERYKNAEFNRDWNLYHPILKDEHFLQTKIAFKKKKITKIEAKSEHLNFGKDYQGYRNSAFTNVSMGKFKLIGNSSLLNTKTILNKTLFYRHNIKLSREVWKVKLGAIHDFENNLQNQIQSDSLLSPSQKYSLGEIFISNADSSKNQFTLSYKNRFDYLPFDNKMTISTETRDVLFNSWLKTHRNQQLKSTVIWRNLKVINSKIVSSYKDEQNLLGRIDHNLNFKKRAISFFTFYEIGTGLENKREFSYIEVATGQGIYVWIDYNNNDIPELNEFEISPFPEEANYLRIYTPTTDYIKVYTLKFNETIKLDPSKIWRSTSGVKGFLGRFSNTFTYRTSHKHTENDFISRINPSPGFVADTSQMNKNSSFRNTLTFNRSHPKFGIDYSFSEQNSKIIQNNGFDATKNTNHQLKIRWNLTAELMLLNLFNFETRSYNSEYFSDKNYTIEGLSNSSTLQWQPTTKFRASAIYQIKNKNNLIGTEKVLLHEVGPEIKINAPKQGMISAKASLIVNNYSGDANAPVSYTMLEGYRPGENYRWSVMYSRNLNNFLRVNLSYTGRKPAQSSTIHTGQFSISAYF
jgi:hypothetical protein